MKRWNIYFHSREYAAAMGDPLLGTVEAETKSGAEEQATRLGMGGTGGVWAVPAPVRRFVVHFSVYDYEGGWSVDGDKGFDDYASAVAFRVQLREWQGRAATRRDPDYQRLVETFAPSGGYLLSHCEEIEQRFVIPYVSEQGGDNGK